MGLEALLIGAWLLFFFAASAVLRLWKPHLAAHRHANDVLIAGTLVITLVVWLLLLYVVLPEPTIQP